MTLPLLQCGTYACCLLLLEIKGPFSSTAFPVEVCFTVRLPGLML